MILTNGLLKLFGRAMVLGALLLVFGRCGSSDDGTPANISAVFMETETTTLDAKGYATDPRLVLTGPVGTAYTVTVTEGGSWCWTSRRTHTTTKSAKLVSANDVVYLYLDDNETGASRRAAVDVVFDGGHEFTLTIDQADYSVPASMDHAWAELPAYVEAPDYRYVTLRSATTRRNVSPTGSPIRSTIVICRAHTTVRTHGHMIPTYRPSIKPTSRSVPIAAAVSAVTSVCPTTAMFPIPRC